MEERMDFRILNNGSFVPSIGFGTYKTGTSEETEQAVTNALQAGYRLLDTAAYYDNEEAVGKGMRASGINRSDIIVTTKIWHTNAGYDATMRAIESSLKKLNTNYIDIMLIHQPIGDYYGSWRAMEELYDQNVLRGLGLRRPLNRLAIPLQCKACGQPNRMPPIQPTSIPYSIDEKTSSSRHGMVPIHTRSSTYI